MTTPLVLVATWHDGLFVLDGADTGRSWSRRASDIPSPGSVLIV